MICFHLGFLLWTKPSLDLYLCRNKGIENVITIDLHGQHVKQAMKLLKMHLLLGAYVPCKCTHQTQLQVFSSFTIYSSLTNCEMNQPFRHYV